jgi:hypothetical protein
MHMAESNDRERLRQLTEQKQQAKAAGRRQQEQQEAEHARKQVEQLASDEQKTKEIFDHCTATFGGYKFKQTNHELRVQRGTKPRYLLGARDVAQDNVDYVIVYADHISGGVSEPVHFLAARFLNGQYELWDAVQLYELATFDQLREKMLDVISRMDDVETMKDTLNHIRSSAGR